MSASLADEWLRLAAHAARFATPFYLFWPAPYEAALARLDRVVAGGPLPVRHWYSFKTLPVPNMALVARARGLGLEVVSRFELAAALRLGVPAPDILVNGVAKHAWLTDEIAGLNVVFESLTEVERLAPAARKLRWTVGLRVAVSGQRDPDDPRYPAQFGLAGPDVAPAVRLLRWYDVPVHILHVHLRSHVPASDHYRDAAEELAAIARACDVTPAVIDLGGGLPEEMIGVDPAAGIGFDWSGFAAVVSDIGRLFPSARSLWFENGRHLLGPAGVLVVTVHDVKTIGGQQFLICDGGRTNQALESDGVPHRVAVLSGADRGVHTVPTVICGPTCMAADWLWRGEFAADIRIGDRVLYFNAGAYHLSWESRFSHGLSRVLWAGDGRTVTEIRGPETPDQWRVSWR